MRNTLTFLLVLLLTLGAAYAGAAGYFALRLELLASSPDAQVNAPVIVNGTEYKNQVQATIAIGHDWLRSWCSTIIDMPHLAILMLTCVAMGMLGAMVRVLYQRVSEGKAYAELPAPSMALLGAAMGMVIYVVIWVAPEAFMLTEKKPVEYAFPAVAALAGLFTKETLNVLAGLVGRKSHGNDPVSPQPTEP